VKRLTPSSGEPSASRAIFRIMQPIYGQAMADIPAMRTEAADRARGQATLDLPPELVAAENYEYEPPWEPPT
jgi:hypothetical protein